MAREPISVFFDANVVISAGKPPGGPLISRVRDLVQANFIKVLTTDLTKIEVAKKHASNDFDVVGEVGRPHFRKIVEELTGVALPSITKTELQDKLLQKYTTSVELMFDALSPTVLSIDTIKPMTVFEAYSFKKGFFSGEGKKDQFSDAFIFECLKEIASSSNKLTIVSDDGDFVFPSKTLENITVLKSIPALFTSLGLKIEAPEIDDFLEANHADVIHLVSSEVDNWGLHISDVEDAEVDEVAIKDVEFLELTSFGVAQGSNEILVVGRMNVEANISYTHPDWDTAMYDSEDKVLIPFENVAGEKDVELKLDFSMTIMTDEEGVPVQIEELQITSESFLWVEISHYDPYEYM